MWEKLKSNRRLQFAVGLAIIIIGLKILFSESLLFAARETAKEPAEGQTAIGFIGFAWGPVLMQTALGIIIGVGAWVMNVGEMLFGRIHSAMSVASAPGVPAAAGDTSDALPVAAFDMQHAMHSLADAAALNDRDSLEKIRIQIRKPYAIAELTKALNDNDEEATDRLTDELRKMNAAPAAPKAKTRGGSNG